MKNAVLVSLFLAGSTLAMPSAIRTPNALSRAIRPQNEKVGNSPCDGSSSSQDKPATDVNLDVCTKATLDYLQKSPDGCKEIPCTDPYATRTVLAKMINCLINSESKQLVVKCESNAVASNTNCVYDNVASNSSTYRIEPPGKQVPIDENLQVTRQCSQQALAVYKQCSAGGEKL